MRQASAEREREQMGRSEAEKQLRQQTEQLNLMENNHHKQQQNAQTMWEQEKVSPRRLMHRGLLRVRVQSLIRSDTLEAS